MRSQLASTNVTPIGPNSCVLLVTWPEITHGERTSSTVSPGGDDRRAWPERPCPDSSGEQCSLAPPVEGGCDRCGDRDEGWERLTSCQVGDRRPRAPRRIPAVPRPSGGGETTILTWTLRPATRARIRAGAPGRRRTRRMRAGSSRRRSPRCGLVDFPRTPSAARALPSRTILGSGSAARRGFPPWQLGVRRQAPPVAESWPGAAARRVRALRSRDRPRAPGVRSRLARFG